MDDVQPNPGRQHVQPLAPELLDELATVYARAAARAYFAKHRQARRSASGRSDLRTPAESQTTAHQTSVTGTQLP
ncbi:hypothetical protein [Peristeroidobacter agariperforans]|uniref:hypothetical protein n=1 Tax=Peristeroidobacter agariperforans TaxID=268404 RepID=UPI0018E4FB7C|nr:hypothetical protein [Peristeroidobacter agariperforans]